MRKGTAQEAADYCKKDGLWIEHGTMSNQGARTDLAEALNSCVTLAEFVKNYEELFVRYHNGIKDAYSLRPKLPREPVIVEWWYGPTGTGKSHAAHEFYPKAFICGKCLNWFNGYNGHDTVIIDDFRKDMCSFAWFLRLTDKYPMDVPTKGGFVDWRPKRIVITCPRRPEEEFVRHNELGTVVYEDIEQVRRRIKNMVHFNVRRPECIATREMTFEQRFAEENDERAGDQ